MDEPNSVVTPSTPEPPTGSAVGSGMPKPGAGATALVTVRVSQRLKAAIEQAASREGRSVEAWLADLAAVMVRQDPASLTAHRRGKRHRQRYTAWVR